MILTNTPMNVLQKWVLAWVLVLLVVLVSIIARTITTTYVNLPWIFKSPLSYWIYIYYIQSTVCMYYINSFIFWWSCQHHHYMKKMEREMPKKVPKKVTFIKDSSFCTTKYFLKPVKKMWWKHFFSGYRVEKHKILTKSFKLLPQPPSSPI